MATQIDHDRPAVFGDEGRVRNRFHTHQGAKVINAFTRPFWSALPPAGFGVLTTVGRRTGEKRQSCVRVIVQDTRAFVVSIVGESADWVRNARQNESVHLRARGIATSARMRDLRDGTETEQARRAYCESLHVSDYIECFLHLRGRPSRSKIRQLHERWFDQGTPLVLELDDPPRRTART